MGWWGLDCFDMGPNQISTIDMDLFYSNFPPNQKKNLQKKVHSIKFGWKIFGGSIEDEKKNKQTNKFKYEKI